jgi:dUTP pyrophosphatase
MCRRSHRLIRTHRAIAGSRGADRHSRIVWPAEKPPAIVPPMKANVRVEILPEHPAYGDMEASRKALNVVHEHDAGIDLVACEPAVIGPGGRALVSAGIRIALPAGVEAQVRPRSGQAWTRGITVANAPGTIDSGYRGPVKVILLNTAPAVTAEDLNGGTDSTLESRLRAAIERHTVRIGRGERIAQLVFSRFERPVIEIVPDVSLDTSRGEGGFGSTGTV